IMPPKSGKGCRAPQVKWNKSMDRVTIDAFKEHILAENTADNGWKPKAYYGVWDPVNCTVIADGKDWVALDQVESRKKLLAYQGKCLTEYQNLYDVMGEDGVNGERARNVGQLVDNDDNDIVGDMDNIERTTGASYPSRKTTPTAKRQRTKPTSVILESAIGTLTTELVGLRGDISARTTLVMTLSCECEQLLREVAGYDMRKLFTVMEDFVNSMERLTMRKPRGAAVVQLPPESLRAEEVRWRYALIGAPINFCERCNIIMGHRVSRCFIIITEEEGRVQSPDAGIRQEPGLERGMSEQTSRPFRSHALEQSGASKRMPPVVPPRPSRLTKGKDPVRFESAVSSILSKEASLIVGSPVGTMSSSTRGQGSQDPRQARQTCGPSTGYHTSSSRVAHRHLRAVTLLAEMSIPFSSPLTSTRRSSHAQDKINVDASFCKDKLFNHIGLVIRDTYNNFGAARASSLRFASSEEGDALAVQDGVLWAQERGLQRVIIETDAEAIHSFCKNGKTMISWTTKAILQDCLVLFGQFINISICYVSRTANSVAHVIATRPMGNNFCLTWVGSLVADVPTGRRGADSGSKRVKVDQEIERDRIVDSQLLEKVVPTTEQNMDSTSLETIASTSSFSATAKTEKPGFDQLPKEMHEMKIQDKPDCLEDKEMETAIVSGNGTETGQIIATTIGGRNGQLKQTISYMAERVVGTGSFGIVFQAKCLESGEAVAIKKVLQDKRYKNRELQIMHLLDHPNVIQLKHFFFSTTEKDELYLNLVLDYVSETVYRVEKHYSRMSQHMPLIYIQLYTYQVLFNTMNLIIVFWLFIVDFRLLSAEHLLICMVLLAYATETLSLKTY
ncbi:hypothetical protein GIB67_028382, partial [Kingdonia uniflora]